MTRPTLLDTCVISELVKKRPDGRVAAWLAGQEEEALFLSVLTIGELEKGIAKLPSGPRRDRLHAWVTGDLSARFENRLLAVDCEVARTWGRLSGEAEARGRKIPVIDALIGATARAHGLDVVTRNTAHLELCGVSCVNPWDDA